MIQVENHPNLAKTDSGLVVDVDKSGYAKYMAQKKSTAKLAELESDINTIKQDMDDIKMLLTKILNKDSKWQQ